jgi:uncharacterized protein YpuA (DUF1002 family)
MNYQKVEGHSNLIRDVETNAILNTNVTEYNNYINMKKMKENESKRVENLENDLASVKDDLKEIKDLLRNFCK